MPARVAVSLLCWRIALTMARTQRKQMAVCLIFELSTEPLEQTYERMRTLREIQEALLSFTPKQRRRFLLHFAYGYTYLEIARMEGSNKSTVMRSAKTALKKIQEKLAA